MRRLGRKAWVPTPTARDLHVLRDDIGYAPWFKRGSPVEKRFITKGASIVHIDSTEKQPMLQMLGSHTNWRCSHLLVQSTTVKRGSSGLPRVLPRWEKPRLKWFEDTHIRTKGNVVIAARIFSFFFLFFEQSIWCTVITTTSPTNLIDNRIKEH